MPVVVVSYPQKALNFTNTASRSLRIALLKLVGMGHVIIIIIIRIITIIINLFYTRYIFT